MTTDLEVYEPPAPVTLFGTDDPADVVARATRAAKPLAEVVETQKLFATIGGKKHVLVEGWTLLGSMLGVFPVTVWTRKLEGGDGFEARVEARTKHGEIVGAAEAQCDRTERAWKTRDDYALRSMAQTRATSKALRQPLGFVMLLAGFDATPAEEMPRDEPGEVVADPDGVVFPDQRLPATGQFAPPPSAVGDLATPQQLKAIGTLMGLVEKADNPHTRESLKLQLQAQYGVGSSKELTKAEASTVIEELKRLADES